MGVKLSQKSIDEIKRKLLMFATKRYVEDQYYKTVVGQDYDKGPKRMSILWK